VSGHSLSHTGLDAVRQALADTHANLTATITQAEDLIHAGSDAQPRWRTSSMICTLLTHHMTVVHRLTSDIAGHATSIGIAKTHYRDTEDKVLGKLASILNHET
jgi:hypothetical protein